MDQNAVTGLVFYVSIIAVIILYMTGKPLPGTILAVIMFGVPLILIFLEEPLKNLVSKKQPLIEDSKGIFAATAFFELFDYLITYLSNALFFPAYWCFCHKPCSYDAGCYDTCGC